MSEPARAQVSRNCETGNHRRCLGTVYVPRFDGGNHIVPCACIIPNCGHGPERKPDGAA